MSEMETRTYTITAQPEQLNVLEKLFMEMEAMGMAGASRDVNLYVDGDGAFRPRFQRLITTRTNGWKLNDIHKKEYGCGYVKRDCDEFKGNGYDVYYDFG